MWQLDYKESWMPKNWCFWTVVLDKILESPLDCKEIQLVHPKGDQSWVFIGRTDIEAETPILWPPDAKSWLIWKDPDAGTYWGREEKEMTEGWMASLTQWTWVWVDSRSWWWTGRPGVLWFMGSQRVRHDWATELNWTDNFTPCTTTIATPLIQTIITSCLYEIVLPCLLLSASLPPSYSLFTALKPLCCFMIPVMFHYFLPKYTTDSWDKHEDVLSGSHLMRKVWSKCR